MTARLANGSRAAAERLERSALLAPSILLLLAVVAVPMFRVLWLSLHEVQIGGAQVGDWVGLNHFVRLWSDSRWHQALGNTMVFTGLSVALEMIFGVGAAVLLQQQFRGRRFARALAIAPWVLPTSVMALAWAWIFNDAFGVANDVLTRLHLMDTPFAWLADARGSMAALVVADVWKTTPFVMLIALAGLQSISHEVLDAARLDGLRGFAQFRRVILPLLLPSLRVALIFRAIQAYGAFDLVYVMTGGGPAGATETVSLYSYRNYFRYLDFGYGSAVAIQATALGAGAAALLLFWPTWRRSRRLVR